MVAVSFGSYASSALTGSNEAWAKAFAALIIPVMTGVNFFAVVTLVRMPPSLLAPSGYPSLRDIVSGVALTFFAFLCFGKAGYWLMTVTALFATAGATNAGLYPAVGMSERLVETGHFPPLMARKLGGQACNGLLIEAAACLVLVTFVLTTLIHEPASIVTLLAILVLSIGLDYGWKRTRDHRANPVQAGH